MRAQRRELTADDYNHLLVAPTTNNEGDYTVACIDKRPPEPDCPVLGYQRYYQQVGGVNIGLPLAVATHIQHPELLAEYHKRLAAAADVPQAELPLLQALGKHAASNMKRIGYDVVIHDNCLFTDNERLVAQSLGNPGHEVLARSRQIDPSLNAGLQNRVAEAGDYILQIANFFSTSEVETYMLRNQGHLGTGPTAKGRLGQANPPRAFIANYTDSMLHVPYANMHDMSAYCASMSLVEHLSESLPEPVDPAILRATMAMTLGVVSLHPGVGMADGTPPPIIRIGEPV